MLEMAVLEIQSVALPQGYELRPARLSDVPATVAMWNAWSKQVIGVEKFDAPSAEAEWCSPGFILDRDTRLVVAPDGQVAGYCEVWDINDPHVRVFCWGRVHPEHAGRGIGSALLTWQEERARQAIPLAPADARVSLATFCLTTDEVSERLFLDHDFTLTRYFLRMVIDLDEMPAEPTLPPGIVIRPMVREREMRAVIQAVQDSFRDHWGHVERPLDEDVARWEHFMEHDEKVDPKLWYVALDSDEIAGVSLCYRKADDDPDMGWVGTLGVRRAYRRQGLGLALLQHSFRELYQLGQRKVGLGVDADSLTGATRLYLKAGMRPDPERQFSNYEKELRPGLDLSTQNL